MYHLSMKNIGRSFHMPTRHNMALRLDHVVHDERFLPIIVALAFMAALVFIAVWVGLTGE